MVIQVYITSARRAYRLADHYRARGAYVALGGLHVTSLPDEAAAHADTHLPRSGRRHLAPRSWPTSAPAARSRVYRSQVRTLEALPPIRRDLIKRHLYLVPNSIVVSRGCPHTCDFCYKEAFFEGGQGLLHADASTRRSRRSSAFPAAISTSSTTICSATCASRRRSSTACAGMGRLWQAAGTVNSVLKPALLEKAVAAGLRSLFVGFETLNPAGLRAQRKVQNLHRDYGEAVRRLHGLGVMVNGSFVFGMDDDDASVFDRTVDVGHRAGHRDRHVPHPHALSRHGSLSAGWRREGRILHRDWDLYDTRHVVFATRGMTADELEAGYWRAYRDFYRWGSIFRGASAKPTWPGRLRHFAYAGGWKKFEPLWDWVIRARKVSRALPLLEAVLG